jgi:hypothetical protein
MWLRVSAQLALTKHNTFLLACTDVPLNTQGERLARILVKGDGSIPPAKPASWQPWPPKKSRAAKACFQR